jgi:hypothetical protein
MARRRTRTTVTYYDRVEVEISHGNDMRNLLQRIVDDIADDARPDAPVSDGKGHARGQHARALIKGEVVEIPDGWEGRVGWTRPAYYLYMHERGWKYRTARPFLRPAVERNRNT